MNYLPKARVEKIVTQEANGELLIYDLSLNRAMCLNETARTVWQACDGKTDFDEFKKSNPNFSDELIWLTLEKLNSDNLFDETVRFVPDFNGLSRREVIKKIGLGTMMALPVISSIVAPSAAHAQSSACGTGSCVPVGGTVNCSFGAIGSVACVNNLTAQCCTGTFSSSSCSCPLGGNCSGSVTCGCASAGTTVSGSFGAIGSVACVNNLNAQCCTGTSSSSSCSCPLGGPCAGSVTCS
jgi:hypothetical protein